jgi:hypothetical protein
MKAGEEKLLARRSVGVFGWKLRNVAPNKGTGYIIPRVAIRIWWYGQAECGRRTIRFGIRRPKLSSSFVSNPGTVLQRRNIELRAVEVRVVEVRTVEVRTVDCLAVAVERRDSHHN